MLEKLKLFGEWTVEMTKESPQLGKAFMDLASKISGESPLVCAAGLGHTAALQVLLAEQNINLAAENDNHFIILHYAAGEGRLETVKFLLEAGIPINTASESGKTPLHQAVIRRHTGVVKYLCQRGANPNIPDNQGFTPLFRATLMDESPELIDILCTHGVDINALDTIGTTLLHYIVMAENAPSPEVMKTLLSHGANFNTIDQNGDTPLHFAARKGKKEAINTALQYQANPNVTDQDGQTPLHIAVYCGHNEIIDLLCQHGANINLADSDGLTPVHFAFHSRRKAADKTMQAALATVQIMKKYDKIADEGLNEKIEAATDPSQKIASLKVKARKRQNKQNILNHKPLIIAEMDKPTPAIAIANVTYCEEPDAKRLDQFREIFINRLEECSQYDPAFLTAPFLAILALATIGRHDKILESTDFASRKRLKLLVTSAAHVGDLSDGLANYSTAGMYTHQSTLFGALGNNEIIHGVSTLFHESTHFLANEVMKNSCEPYPFDDIETKNRYEKIVKEVETTISNPEFTSDIPQIKQVIANFRKVFLTYESDKHGLELFVQIAQTIAMLGYQDGTKWLADYFSDLLEFYSSYFNPACMQYLKNHHAEQFLTLDESFITALNTVETNTTPITFKDGITPLHKAASRGKTTVVEALCKNGGNVDAVDKNGLTPLHYAVDNGDVEIINILHKYCANTNLASKRGLTVLKSAILHNRPDIVQILCQHNADVKAENDETTPLQLAVYLGYEQIIDILCQHGANVDSLYDGKNTLLQAAINRGHIGTVQTLLAHKANVHAANPRKETALHAAAADGHIEIINTLFQHGANINAMTSYGYTPLHVAASCGHTETVKVLLAHEANIDATNTDWYDRKTALHLAAENGHMDVINILLAHNADVNAINQYGETAFHVAAKAGQVEIVKRLLAYRPEFICMVTNNGHRKTALHLAAEKGRLEVINLLLAEQPDLISILTLHSQTALHFAAEKGCIEVFNVLLKHNANIHAINDEGETVLHIATRYGRTDIVSLLLAQGVNVDTVNQQNKTPLQIATQGGNAKTVKILCQQGAQVEVTDREGATPLHFAAQYKNSEIVNILCENGAKVNATIKGGFTPLYVAAYYGNTEIVDFLCQRGANTEITDHEDKTPLQVANERGHTETARILLQHQHKTIFLQQVVISPPYKNLMAQIDIIESQKNSFWQDLSKNEATQKALREIQQKIIKQNDSVENIISFIKAKKPIIDQPTGIAPTFFQDSSASTPLLTTLLEQLESFVQQQKQNHNSMQC